MNTKLTATTWQTVGPFFQIGLERFYINDLTTSNPQGHRIEIKGRIRDGDNQGVPDAVIEIWQADAHGKYFSEDPAEHVEKNSTRHANPESANPAFRGFGRIATSEDGSFHFKTIEPGAVAAPDGTLQSPHIAVSIFMRGLLRRLTTRVYFPDAATASPDFILRNVPAARRHTLIAKHSSSSPNMLEWNILLQGPEETVFFEW